jgi:hypothetical protein
MKLFERINNFIHKAKQEASREYSVAAAVEDSGGGSGSGEKAKARRGWIGVDLDGTLAHAEPMTDTSSIGAPVPRMVELVRKLSREGYRIKIFTARACDSNQIAMVREWLRKNGLPEFEVTNVKDFEMIRLYDDRAVQVIPNTGETVGVSRL